mgnify:CR=1 FL=1|tara:strand:- start:453 stop:869 length:417 start_codon:yes stop_codon:yes gene_type:complete
MVKKIINNNVVLAIILRSNESTNSIEFYTPDDYSQQLGLMKRPKGYEIPPHVHKPVAREIIHTQEVLFVRKGSMHVDFYDDDKRYLSSEILSTGDCILLASGGHGFRMKEETEIIEIKQGPYAGEKDKERFKRVLELE